MIVSVDYCFLQYQRQQNNIEIDFDYMPQLVTEYCQQYQCNSSTPLPFTNVQIIKFSDVAANTTIVEQLKSFQVIVVAGKHGDYFYKKLNANYIMRFGPVAVEPILDNSWYTSGFYLMLAAIIFIGLYPIFHDMYQLKFAAQGFVKSRDLHHLRLPKSRYFQPVNDSFCWMIKKISRLVALQKELSSTLSHELRTSLSRLNFSLATLDETNVEETKVLLQQDIDELNRLVNEYLEFSKQDQEVPHLHLTEQSIVPMVKHYMELLGQYSSKTIRFHCQSDLLVEVDERLIARAIKNLIDNGIKYSNQLVVISLYQHGNQLVLQIEDDGLGVNIKEVDELFLPYSRAEHNEKIAGYGLGLAITRKIIDWHQAQLKVSNSRELSGACFQLFLNTHSGNIND
ncbi:sensor histidine kinase [Thalassotalea sp. PLHSN55]|uniref:sensor histidine kinase n=1 Tax=Thalassotalea sp. PLHSN55 TaxID=3435888 RepID=UPI003F880118